MNKGGFFSMVHNLLQQICYVEHTFAEGGLIQQGNFTFLQAYFQFFFIITISKIYQEALGSR